MPGAFPYVVLGNGAGAEGRGRGLTLTRRSATPVAAKAAKNPVFEAYVRRSAPAGRTARQALVLALAEADAPAGGPAAGEDFSSYGVTSAPAPAAPEPVAAAAVPKVSSPVRLARKARMTVETPADKEPAPLMPLPTAASAVPFMPALPAEPTPESMPGKLKVALRRSGAGTPPPVAPLARSEPPSEASFLMGPVMDGTRAPLLPIPGVAAAIPIPAPAGEMAGAKAGQTSGFLVPLTVPGAETEKKENKAAAASVPKKADPERGVLWGRMATAAVIAAFLILGSYEWQQRGLWPFHAESGPAIVAATPAPMAQFWKVEVTAGQAVPAAAALTADAVDRPAPGRDFVQMVERFKITGVLQTKPARAIVDGRIVEAGEMVDFARGIRMVGLDREKHLVIFEDQTSARAAVRY